MNDVMQAARVKGHVLWMLVKLLLGESKYLATLIFSTRLATLMNVQLWQKLIVLEIKCSARWWIELIESLNNMAAEDPVQLKHLLACVVRKLYFQHMGFSASEFLLEDISDKFSLSFGYCNVYGYGRICQSLKLFSSKSPWQSTPCQG